jgi:nicotinamidase/pyrazinamidase
VTRYDDRTALIVVDMQNDFTDPAGGLYVTGGEQILPVVNAEVEAAAAAGAAVIYTADWHPADTPHFAKDGGVWPVHCVRDTWGAALHPALRVDGPVVRKGDGGEDGYSGFSVRDPVSGERGETRLGGLLRERGVTGVVVVGLAGDYCVGETAVDARRLGFETSVIEDAVRYVELTAGDADRMRARLTAGGVRVVGSESGPESGRSG